MKNDAKVLQESRKEAGISPNRLDAEKSLYLRQHGKNPVNWYPWADEALEKARREDKPLFVSIGYAACHWCHVMEKESFSDGDIASFLNSNFVSIKVDREERPDIDQAFMDAVMVMTGGGGWPLSVFLTPDLKPFFGGTYFPPQQFMRLIRLLYDAFTKRRPEVESQASLVQRRVSAEVELKPGALDEQTLDSVISDIERLHDRDWGGIGKHVKFPQPVIWQFLLRHFRKSGLARAGDMVRTTLEHMASGGLQDHLAGGFHRYATERTWLVPHFEKMLYDNALLAQLYLEAAVAYDEPRYAETAGKTMDFMIDEMVAVGGGFASSLDADSAGEEGVFYLWTPAEIENIAGPDDGAALSALLGVTERGNFYHKNILTRRADPKDVAARLGRSEKEIAGLLDKYAPGLLERRKERVAPVLDRKVITAWNGLAISAMAKGFGLLGDKRYLDTARRAADFLLAKHRAANGRLYRYSNDGEAGGAGILDDYAFFARGLIDLFEVSAQSVYLKSALELIEHVLDNFRHAEAGFYLTARDRSVPLGRRQETSDGVLPSGNSVMLGVIRDAAMLTSRRDWLEQVSTDIAVFSGALAEAGFRMVGMCELALFEAGSGLDIFISGQPAARDTRRFLNGFYRWAPPNAVLVSLPASGPSDELLEMIPSAANKIPSGEKATAYMCRFGSCSQPVDDIDEYRNKLLQAWNSEQDHP